MTLDHRKPAQPAWTAVEGGFEPRPPAHSGWDPALVNGSASAGLLAALLERELVSGTVDPGAPALAPTRITVDLLRPVPFRRLDAATRTVRAGRRLRLVEADLLDGDRLVARASGVFLAATHAPSFATPRDALVHPDELASARLLPDFDRPLERPPFQHYCDVRWATPYDSAEPAVWVRPPETLAEGLPPSPLSRALAVADLLAGLIATHQTYVRGRYESAINADLHVVLAGPPVGDWFGLRLDRLESHEGVGFACAELFDLGGYRGRVTHTRVGNAAEPAVMRG